VLHILRLLAVIWLTQKEVSWIDNLHISLELYAYLYSLQYSSQYVHKNFGRDKRVIILAIDKHFGLVEKGQSLPLGNTSNRQKDRKGTYKRSTEARSRNHCCRGKAISIKYSECA